MKVTELNAWLSLIRKIQLIQKNSKTQTKKPTTFKLKGF